MRWLGIVVLAALAGCATAGGGDAVGRAQAAVEAAAEAGDEAALARAIETRNAARARLLEPLAARGDTEAMMRLASDIRDDDSPEAVRRWLSLTTRAAAGGHTGAHDELTRWWWHQRGDGSLAAVQRYRTRALDHAEAAAQAGDWTAVARIGVYIRGDVHQFPASPGLAAEVARLAGAKAPWSASAGEWRRLRAEILARGATSLGPDGSCSTSKPWCRGRFVDLD